jgi:hypothetical protein
MITSIRVPKMSTERSAFIAWVRDRPAAASFFVPFGSIQIAPHEFCSPLRGCTGQIYALCPRGSSMPPRTRVRVFTPATKSLMLFCELR